MGFSKVISKNVIIRGLQIPEVNVLVTPKQTAEYLLLDCSVYETERRQLESNLDDLPLTM
jgi:hypothetical protein